MKELWKSLRKEQKMWINQRKTEGKYDEKGNRFYRKVV